MKRIPELRSLSEDHHHGLVLARRARRGATGGEGLDAATVWVEVRRRFEEELEPHFRIEETYLAPPLEALGELQLVQRLHEEHTRLRQLALGLEERTSKELDRFGLLLEKHIRFEEREFFQVAQECLDEKALKAVEEACRRLKQQSSE